jgi:hypothetical protein
MIKEENNQEDLLRHYLSPEKIERAPEGFTSKVMTRIQMESLPVESVNRFRNKYLVPVISTVITFLLIAAAFLTHGIESDPLTSPLAEFIKDMKISFPEINISSIFTTNLPSLLIYVFIGILMLSLFDRALSRLFHRR